MKPNRCDSDEWHEEAIRRGRKGRRGQQNGVAPPPSPAEQLSQFDKCTWSAACHVVTTAQCFRKVRAVRVGQFAKNDECKFRQIKAHPPEKCTLSAPTNPLDTNMIKVDKPCLIHLSKPKHIERCTQARRVAVSGNVTSIWKNVTFLTLPSSSLTAPSFSKSNVRPSR